MNNEQHRSQNVADFLGERPVVYSIPSRGHLSGAIVSNLRLSVRTEFYRRHIVCGPILLYFPVCRGQRRDTRGQRRSSEYSDPNATSMSHLHVLSLRFNFEV